MTALHLVNGIAYGNLLFLMAAGFTLIFGVLRVINMAHGSLYLLGAYVAISTAESGGGFLTGILAGAAVAATLGALAERSLLYRLQGDYLAQVFVTIGLYLIVSDLALWWWGGGPKIMPLPSWLDFGVMIGPFRYPGDRLVLILVGPVAAVILWYWTERTLLGARIRAAVDDEEIAQAIGISVPSLRVVVFAIGSLLAGFSGALGSTFVGAKPGLDIEVFLLALVIVVIGGPGSLVGSYIAAISIGMLDSIGKSLWPEASLFLVFVPMLLVLIVRPSGLFGRANVGQAAVNARPPISIPIPFVFFHAAGSLRYGINVIPRWAIGASAACLAIAMPWLISDYILSVLTLGLIWSIGAIGLNIMLGYGGMPSLGHAAFFGAGAYIVAAAASAGLGGGTALIAACVLAAFVAVLLAAVALQARHAQFLLVTLAFSQVLWGIVFKWRSITGGDDGLIHSQQFGIQRLFGHAIDAYFSVLGVFFVALAAYCLFDRSNFRVVVTGLRSNEGRLRAFGYNIEIYRGLTLALSGVFGGLAGGLYSIHAGFVSPDLFGLQTSAKMLLMVILGGAGTFFGPIVGAFTLIGLEEVLSGLTARWPTLLGLVYILVTIMTWSGLVLVPSGKRPRHESRRGSIIDSRP
jgi:branched-chain amino acid transport system permease protein